MRLPALHHSWPFVVILAALAVGATLPTPKLAPRGQLPGTRSTPLSFPTSAPTPVSMQGQGDGYSFRLDLDPSGMVSIYSLGAQNKLPQDMSVTLFRDETNGDSVRLHAAPIHGSPPNTTVGPQYQGRLDPSSQNFVAAELQFGIGGEKDRHRIRAEIIREAAGTVGEQNPP